MWGVKYFDLFDKLAGGAFEIDEIFDCLFVTLKAGGVKGIKREMFDDMDHDAEFISVCASAIVELFDRTQIVESELQDEKQGEKKT